MRWILFPFFIFIHVLIQAQPLARFQIYHFNPDFSNPAACGLTQCLEFTGTTMHQWLGIKNAPNTQSFSIQKGIPFLKTKISGVGINIVRDVNGPSNSTAGELLYSFQTLINKRNQTWLSMGISGFIDRRRLNETDFTPVYDPAISGGNNEELVFNAAAGIYFYNKQYFGGAAVYNLIPNSALLGNAYGGDNYFVSLQAGFLLPLRKLKKDLQLSAQAGIGKTEHQIDLNSKLFWGEHFWGGLTFRKYIGNFGVSGQNALIFIGYNWNNWGLCYNYNFDINGTQFHHYGTHRFAISYHICRDKEYCPAYQ